MTQHDKLWNDINNLLSLLRGLDAVELVDNYYQQYKNDAPAKLLKLHMEDLQKQLDKAPKGKTSWASESSMLDGI